jgi:ribosomal protein S18 acetylase RimI-like enzyme
MSFSIRQLGPDDVNAYRQVRLKALMDHPEAYGVSPESFSKRTDQEIASFLSEFSVFGLFDPELCGIAAFQQSTQERERHRGGIYQVYAAPHLRGTGAARELIDHIAQYAKAYVSQLHLGVGTENHSALRLYEKAGFEIYGTDPRALNVNGRYIDEHQMVRFL